MSPTRSLSPLSALTALSDDEDEEAPVPSLPETAVHEAYGKVVIFTLIRCAYTRLDIVIDIIGNLERQISAVGLGTERREDLMDSLQLLRRRASQKPYKVAFVGRTGPLFISLPLSIVNSSLFFFFLGSGKSTLLNALLQHSLLPTSGKGAACTSVVTEISYSEGSKITAKILYKTPAQWKVELNHLIADALETNAYCEESTETSQLSPAYQAREKLHQIYPHLRELDAAMWDADSLLSDPAVSDYLGEEPTISATDHEDFGKKLEQCLSSCGERSIWALVQRVHIRGAFPVLSTGITLVDLPGHGDVDNTRDNLANEYMRDADTVFLVTPIARSIDDRDTHKYLEQHLSQIFVDGRIGEKSIALILTGTDIPFDEKGVEADLATEIDQLTAQIEVLKQRVANGLPKKVEEWKKKITAKRQAREQRILRRNNLLAQRRSHSVASALREKHQQIYRALSQLPDGHDTPHIPIFCVGSCDYLCLSRLLPATPLVFSSKEDTSIPALHEYIQLIGEFHNLTDGVDILAMTYQFLNRASHAPSENSDVAGIRRDILDLEKRCTDSTDVLVQSIEGIFNRIAAEVAKAVGVAEVQSPAVFESLALRLRWNQYLALMRRDGEYGGNNLNADLTAIILSSVQSQWHLGINVEIAAVLSNFFQDMGTDLDETIRALGVRSASNIDTVRKSLGLELFMKELSHDVQQSITSRQRKGSRIWAPSIKERLLPQYATAATQKGRGMFGRMKEAMKFDSPLSCGLIDPLLAQRSIHSRLRAYDI
ncbi:P-loop containing nucleoside triphosphate hydrolase protein [Mycena leptocephala]|nr:P-loop containing nucleoside triphosphate hydrolase protein [Mycena leptocephala]